MQESQDVNARDAGHHPPEDPVAGPAGREGRDHLMIEILHDSGARLYACQLAMDMFERTREDLLPQVEDVITAGDFFDLSEGAQIIFT